MMLRALQIGCLACLAALDMMAQAPAGPTTHGWSGSSRFAFMGFGPDMSQPIPGAPYSAVQTTQFTQKLPDGNTIQRTEQANVYRDSVGRVRIEHNFSSHATSGTQTKFTAVSIFDPVAGVTYMLQPNSMKAVKSSVRTRSSAEGSSRMYGHHSSSSDAPAQTENLGNQTINGLAATGTRTTQIIPVGAIGNTQQIQIVREVWVSQDLKVPVMIKTSDPRFGDTTMQLANIVQANPDASLFQVPSGYTVEAAPDRFGSHGGWPQSKGSNR